MIKMIIDAHIHIHHQTHEKTYESVQNILQSMKSVGIRKAIIIGLYPKIKNEHIMEVCQTYSKNFVGFASVDPLGGKKSAKELEKCINVFDLRGLKLHPRLQKFNLDNPKVEILIDKASELGVPVMIDFFVTKLDSAPFKAIEKFAKKFQDVNFILAHMGGIMLWDAFFLAKQFKNIYMDMSFTPSYFEGSSIFEDIKFIIKKLNGEKIIYGSDHPEINIVDSLKTANKIFSFIKLPESCMEKIFSKNIKSIMTGL